jgi:hypothetical protein
MCKKILIQHSINEKNNRTVMKRLNFNLRGKIDFDN